MGKNNPGKTSQSRQKKKLANALRRYVALQARKRSTASAAIGRRELLPIQQRPRNHRKRMYVLCYVALQAKKRATASAGIGGKEPGFVELPCSFS